MQGKDLKEIRSKFLYEKELALVWQQWPETQQGRAVKRVRSLPVEVRTEGLSTVLAVLLAEGRAESTALADLLARWLLRERPYRILRGERVDGRGLLDACLRTDRPTYQAAQTEVLALLDQLKILADALYSDAAEKVSDA